MILIADSGSSKTDWRVLHKDGQISQFRGIGFNPYYLSVSEMTQQLKQDFLLNFSDQIEDTFQIVDRRIGPDAQDVSLRPAPQLPINGCTKLKNDPRKA